MSLLALFPTHTLGVINPHKQTHATHTYLAVPQHCVLYSLAAVSVCVCVCVCVCVLLVLLMSQRLESKARICSAPAVSGPLESSTHAHSLPLSLSRGPLANFSFPSSPR